MVTVLNLDRSIFHFINQSLSNPVFDAIMPFITGRAVLLILPVIVWMLLSDRRAATVVVIVAIISLTFSDGISNLLKHLIERPRPFLDIPEAIVLVGKGSSASIPSGHATNVFSVVTVLIYMIYSRWDARGRGLAAGYLLGLALLVSFSRVYVGVHYPSDVIAGSILGITAGSAVVAAFNFSRAAYGRDPWRTVFVLSIFFLSLFRIYYILIGPLDLSPDEAHYWEWSRRLDLSYYSKGPSVAYVIAAGTFIFGNTEFAIRFPAVIFSLLSSVVLYCLTRDILRRDHTGRDADLAGKTGVLAALLIQVMPLFSAYGVVMTIDSPFILLWSLSLYLFYHAQSKRNRGSLPLWVLTGLTVGAGLLTKYTMAFFYPIAFLYLILSGERRRLLLGPGPWIGFLISILSFIPVILWNYNHGWVTLLHTAGQAHFQEGFRLTPFRFFEFIGSQFGVITPFLFVFLLYSIFYVRKRVGDGAFLIWFSVPVLVFFMLKSLQGKVQANWALPGYISAVVSLGIYAVMRWVDFGRVKKAFFVSGILIAVLLNAVAHYPGLINLPPDMDPSARLRGWNVLGREVGGIAAGMERPFFILSDSYQVSSELAFYVRGNPVTYCINRGRRMNQYDLWPGFHHLRGYNVILVLSGDGPMPADMASLFEKYEKRSFRVMEGGKVLRSYSIFLCYGFKGMEGTAPERF